MKYFYKSKIDNIFYIKKAYRLFNDSGKYTDDVDLTNINEHSFITELHKIFLNENKKEVKLGISISNKGTAIIVHSEETRFYLYNISGKILNDLILEFKSDSSLKEVIRLANLLNDLNNEAKLKLELD